MDTLITALYLTIPLIFAGIIHMIVIKKKLLSAFRVPICPKLFGENKTYRGFLVMPVVTFVGVALIQVWHPLPDSMLQVKTPFPVWIGLILGLAYVAFELPNSFLKRRLGIPAGKLPEKNKLTFFILDHVDSATGCVLVYALFLDVPAPTLVLTWVLAPLIHTLINLMLYAMKIRKEKF